MEIIIPQKMFSILNVVNGPPTLTQVSRLLKQNYPDIVTGWNSISFDMVYIVNRLRKMYGEDKIKELSPWGHVNEDKGTDYFGNEQPLMNTWYHSIRLQRNI